VIGAGTIINPILKVVTTVAILGAVYLFIVRPVLDTTETLSERTAEHIERSRGEADERSAQIVLDTARNRASSFALSLEGSWPEAAREVRGCVKSAGKRVGAIERCSDEASRIAHVVQSDWSFANSYADSLESQGDAAGAERVRDCVRKAGFRVGPMQRCRDLADELLFG
jgi:hypothetical protein